jgi:hypothetical protein
MVSGVSVQVSGIKLIVPRLEAGKPGGQKAQKLLSLQASQLLAFWR